MAWPYDNQPEQPIAPYNRDLADPESVNGVGLFTPSSPLVRGWSALSQPSALPPGVYPPNTPEFQAANPPPKPEGGWGGLQGEIADVMTRMQVDPGVGTPIDQGPMVKDSGAGQPAPRGPLTYAELMAGLPSRTGGGSSSVSTTNAVLTPGQGAAFTSRLGEATEGQKGAVGEKSAIAQSMYRQLADNSREQAHGLAAMMKAHEAKQADVEAKVNAQMADNQKMLQSIKATVIDPERLYKQDGGGWLQARHSIALALGAFSAGLLKSGTNPVLAIVEGKLQLDMKAQLANLETKKSAFTAGRGLLSDLFAQNRDLEKTFLMGKMVYTDIAKAQVDALTKDAQSDEAKQNGIITSAKLDEAQVDAEMKLKQLEYKRVVRTQTSSAGGLTPAAQMAMQAVMAQRLAAGGGVPAKNLPGKQAGEIGEMVGGYKNTEEILTEAMKKGGSSWASYLVNNAPVVGLAKIKGTEAERYDSWRTAQSVAIAKMVNGGRPSPEDAKAVENLLPRYGEPNFPLKAAQTLRWMRSRIAGQAASLAQQGYNTESFRGIKGVEAGLPQPAPAIDTTARPNLRAMPGLKSRAK